MLSQFSDVVLVAVEDGRLADAQGAAGVGALAPGVPQALSRLAAQQHGRDVVDLVGRLGAGALLRLRDPTTLAPALTGVQDEHQAQDGQQQGDHATLDRRKREIKVVKSSVKDFKFS